MTAAAVLPHLPGTSTVNLAGPAGDVAVQIDVPTGTPRGLALVAHPQPLLGGSPRHPIPHRWARAVCAAGWIVLRPSFRGVGSTQGSYDHGVGETEDVLAVLAWARAHQGDLPVALSGFSFGAYVCAHVAARLAAAGVSVQAVVLAGLPVGGTESGRVYDTPDVPGHPLLLHGEADAQAPLAEAMAWARRQGHPITIVPGADHVFSNAQPWLAQQVVAHLGHR